MYYLGGSVAEYQISTFMYDSVLKGRFVFLYSCSLYSHPDYRYLHWTDCGRLIIEKSIKKTTVKTTTIITIHMTKWTIKPEGQNDLILAQNHHSLQTIPIVK